MSHQHENTQLSDVREKIISILPIPASILSIFGSVSIIYMACRKRRNQNWTPYTRLLLGMSCSDILFSITWSLSAFLLPKETSHRAYAVGNDATCSGLGFLLQLSYSAMLYNGMLSFYFLLRARFGLKDDFIARRIEPLMHIVSLGFPLATAIAGSVMGVWHEMGIGPGCWVTEYPKNCGDIELGRSGEPCRSNFIAYIFGGTVMVFAVVSITANNIAILIFVTRQTKRKTGKRKVYTGKDDIHSTTDSRQVEESLSVSFTLSLPTKPQLEQPEEDATEPQLQQPEEDARMRKDQLRRLQLVASQAFLYVGAFFLSTGWSFVLRIAEGQTSFENEAELEKKLFPLLIFQAWFLPVQGLLNLLVYARPKYLKCRSDFPNESKVWSFRRAVYGDKTKQTQDSHTPKPQAFILDVKQQSLEDSSGEVDHRKKNDNHQDVDIILPIFTQGTVSISLGANVNQIQERHLSYSRRLPRNFVSSLTGSLGDFDANVTQIPEEQISYSRRLPRDFVSSLTGSLDEFQEQGQEEKKVWDSRWSSGTGTASRTSKDKLEMTSVGSNGNGDPMTLNKEERHCEVPVASSKNRMKRFKTSKLSLSFLGAISELSDPSVSEIDATSFGKSCLSRVSNRAGGMTDTGTVGSSAGSSKKRVRFRDLFIAPSRRWNTDNNPTMNVRRQNTLPSVPTRRASTNTSPTIDVQSEQTFPTYASGNYIVPMKNPVDPHHRSVDLSLDRRKETVAPPSDAPIRTPTRSVSSNEIFIEPCRMLDSPIRAPTRSASSSEILIEPCRMVKSVSRPIDAPIRAPRRSRSSSEILIEPCRIKDTAVPPLDAPIRAPTRLGSAGDFSIEPCGMEETAVPPLDAPLRKPTRY